MVVGTGLVLRGQKSETVNEWQCSRNICYYAETLRNPCNLCAGTHAHQFSVSNPPNLLVFGLYWKPVHLKEIHRTHKPSALPELKSGIILLWR